MALTPFQTTIPKRINFIWWQGACQMPSRYREVIESWRFHHPEWTLTVWDQESVFSLLGELPKDRGAAFSSAMRLFPFDIQRIDLARLIILLLRGGLYSDLDIVSLRPVDNLFGENSFYICREPEPFVSYCNAFIASAPKQCILSAMIAAVLENAPRQRPDGVHPNAWVLLTTGPRALTPVLEKCREAGVPGACFDAETAHIYPKPWNQYILPVDRQLWSTLYPHSYAIHLWDKSWHRSSPF